MTLHVEDADEYGCTAYTATARWETGPGLHCWLIYDVRPDPPPERYEHVWELLRGEIRRQERGADTGRD